MPISSNLSEIMIDKKMTYEELQYRSKVAPDTVARARDERIASCKLLTLESLPKHWMFIFANFFSTNQKRNQNKIKRERPWKNSTAFLHADGLAEAGAPAAESLHLRQGPAGAGEPRC